MSEEEEDIAAVADGRARQDLEGTQKSFHMHPPRTSHAVIVTPAGSRTGQLSLFPALRSSVQGVFHPPQSESTIRSLRIDIETTTINKTPSFVF